jgi:hypothetical protein
MIKEKEFHSDTFSSDILKSACGFEVMISFEGSVTVMSFPNRPVGVQDVRVSIAAMVFRANNKTVRFRGAQIEITQVKPHIASTVTATFTTAGHTIHFTGVQRINLDTGETTLQSHDVSGEVTEVICRRLSASP